jgi:PAS domain S-box-containing protein
MSSKVEKDPEPIPYQALLDENHALRNEVQNLRVRLAEAEELRRAISEGDLDALVIPSPEGQLVFTLDSADHAYRVLVETMNEGTATLACDGTILYCNRHFAELLRMPLPHIIGTSIYRFIAPDNTITFKVLLEKERGKGEINMLAEGSAFLPVYLSVSSLQVDGSPNAWCLVVTDLTEQKKNEEILANIESARKKEIHHRIKNNLQVISSLLDLEAEKLSSRGCIENSEVFKAFKESQERIMSIALIHEELHEGREVDKLKFSAYLEKLVENLFQTYNLGSTDVSLIMDMEENIFLNMDTAVPLGIIVNELVSNSLKHAFSGRKEGKIEIKLHSDEAGNAQIDREKIAEKGTEYTLIVSDDGVGIPEEVDFESSDTLGLQLVNILAEQLDGSIELKSDKGAEFIIKFNTTDN